MKNNVLLVAFLLITGSSYSQNGLERIVVETYYVSNAADSTGSFDNGGGNLPSGSVTYRLYADMLPGYKFQAAYGVPGHTLILSTTTSFFNNEDRGSYQPNWTKPQAANNSVMLDSYLSVGGVTTVTGGNLGLLKSDDNGVATIVNNDGMLANNDALAGIPLTVQDGFITGTVTAPTFVGISSGVPNELDVLDALSQVGNLFTTSNGSWAALTGAMGPNADTNRVLFAQITTDGVFHYELNIQIGTPTGGVENYVAMNPVGAEIQIPSLIGTVPATTPVADFNASSVQFCATGSTTFTDASTNSPSSWQWTFPGGIPSASTAQNPVVTYMVKGTYDVTLTATNGSGNGSTTKTGYIVVDSLPLAQVNPSGNSTICKGANLLLNAITNVPSATYQWQKNNIDIPGAVASTYLASQQAAYRVRVTNTNNSCSKRSVPMAVILQQPTAPISQTGNTTFCSGGSVQLQTSGGGSNTFQWLRNNTAISGAVSPIYSASSYGSYKVRVTDPLGCTNTSGSIYVTVYQNPNVTVSANGPLTFCAGQSVTLSVVQQPNTTYQWTNNLVPIGGATSNSYVANAAGKYRITASDNHTCTNTSSPKTVIVNCRIGQNDNSEESFGSIMNSIELYPNPANSEAYLTFNMNDDGMADISIYDLSGKRICTVIQSSLNAGAYELPLNTNQLAGGIYLVKISAGNQNEQLKLVVNH